MGWLEVYCGTDSPSVLSPSVPYGFSDCFSETVLQSWDAALLFLVTATLFCLSTRRARVAFNPPALPSFQRVLLVTLAALPLLRLLAAVIGHNAPPFRIASLVLRCLTWLVVAVLLSMHVWPSRVEGLHVVTTRLVLWLQAFALLSLVSTAFAVYGLVSSMVQEPVIDAAGVITILTTVIHAALALSSLSAISSLTPTASPTLLLQAGASPVDVPSSSSQPADVDADDELLDPPDSDNRGCLSSFTFSWVSPTIGLGLSQGFLYLTDVPPLPSVDGTADIAEKFAGLWQVQLRSGSPSLLRAFWALIGPSYIGLGVLKFVSDLTVFIGPILLDSLVSFLSSQSTPTPEAVYHGYLYSAGLILGVVVSSVLGTQYTYRSRRVAMRVRSAIVSVVYKKSLTISGMAKRAFSSGTVTNVMSVDTERVMDISTSFHDFWSLPVQIAVALFLLHAQVGLALLAGLGVVVVLIPINAVLTNKIAGVSRRMMSYKDRRVALTNELLHQIRTIKVLALEPRFQRKITAVRRKELSMLRYRKYLDALCVYFWATTPILVSLATFGMYVGLGNALTASKVFTSLALFNTLIRPLNSFPWVINGLVEGRVSALRVRRFLCAEDWEGRGVGHNDSDGDLTVDLQGSFAYRKIDRPTRVLVKPGREGHKGASGQQKWLRLEQDSGAMANGHPRVNGAGDVKMAVSGGSAAVFHLKDVVLRVRPGEFVGICGSVGSGKSSLLLAILGELWGMRRSRLPVRAQIRGSVAYVAQEAWIQNATLRDNVLFGRPYEPERYQRVLEAVALLPDLAQLPAGDATEIGEGGINLSGGQKVRVSIARAAYADCDVYLLDDILSAVDVHVGWHLITRLVHGLLRDKTVLLVTHAVHFLREADQIVQMKNGRIAHTFVSEDSREHRRLTPPHADLDPANLPTDGAGKPTLAEDARASIEAQVKAREVEREEEERLARLTVDESRQRGAIRRRVLRVYLAQIGPLLVGLIVLSMVLMQGSRNYSDYYLGAWSAQDTATGGSNITSTSTWSFSLPHPLWTALSFPHTLPRLRISSLGDSADPGSESSGVYHLKVLALIALFNSLSALFRAFIFAYGGLVAARRMFDALLSRVLYARVAFFDENPVGRILNRFSTDMYSIDENIPFQGNIFLAQTFLLLGALVIIAITTPLFLALIPPLTVGYVVMQRRYRATSRELRRLDSVTRSPIYSTFSETLSGVYTVRAFGATERFLTAFAVLLDTNQRVYYLALCASQWLNVRLQLIGLVIIAFLCFSAILLSTDHSLPSLAFLDVTLVGLAIAYALPLTDTLNNLIGSFTDTEKEIVSVERAIEYLDINTELESDSDDDTANLTNAAARPGPSHQARARRRVNGQKSNGEMAEALLPNQDARARRRIAKLSASALASWPSAGRMEFSDVTLIYRAGLQPALSHVSFVIPGGAHVGVVGRTGAGKSSLLQVLLRMRNISTGQVLIDGADIRSVPLSILRRRLCVIPQSPVLFTGSVRDNVDVYGEHDDRAVWAALEQCHIKEKVISLGRGLHARVGEFSDHFSVGQRQLLCFCRALLQRARIVMLDEASASLDVESDGHIQRLTAGMVGCTVLVIAHRIHTVMGMDRVMVIEDGGVAEFDSPQALMEREGGGRFRSLVEQSHDRGGVVE